MSLPVDTAASGPEALRRAADATARRRSRAAATGLRAYGEPLLWLTSGGLAASLMMIVGLLALVLFEGIDTFWPVAVVRVEVADGPVVVGEVTREEWYRPADAVLTALPEATRERAQSIVAQNRGESLRRLVRTGNFERTGEHFRWVSDFSTVAESRPEWAMVVERR